MIVNIDHNKTVEEANKIAFDLKYHILTKHLNDCDVNECIDEYEDWNGDDNFLRSFMLCFNNRKDMHGRSIRAVYNYDEKKFMFECGVDITVKSIDEEKWL